MTQCHEGRTRGSGLIAVWAYRLAAARSPPRITRVMAVVGNRCCTTVTIAAVHDIEQFELAQSAYLRGSPVSCADSRSLVQAGVRVQTRDHHVDEKQVERDRG